VDGRIFGGFSFDPWKEHNKFFGSSRNALFSLVPTIQIMKSKVGSNGSYQWLNSSTYGAPHGIGFGGTREHFRLFIPDTLENCTFNPSCLTYESAKSGDELMKSSFEIDCLEIWACGGQDAVHKGIEAQQVSRFHRDEAIQKARKVDKAQFFNSSFDQEFLLSGTFQHRDQVSNR
jgi:hypothetical protein